MISSLVPELTPEDSSKGYYIGAELLSFLAPKTTQKTLTVPVSTEYNRCEISGVMDRDIIAKQTQDALKLLNDEMPDKILTLGGDCSVSVVPFTYLANKYKDDVAVIWIDAHPDITLPEDNTYNGYHAMALAAVMGKGDSKILSELPCRIEPSNILFVGLRDWERESIKSRQQEYGIKHLTPEEVSSNSNKILEWIEQIGAKNILIHFDMDVLEPSEIVSAVGVVEHGMKINEVVRVINDISNNYNLIALTVAEPMPRIAIKLKNMMEMLPLFE